MTVLLEAPADDIPCDICIVGTGPAGIALAFVVAIFGYGLIARVQLVLSILTGVLVIGVVVLTFPWLDLSAAQTVADGPWMLLVTGVVLVVMVLVASVTRFARAQREVGLAAGEPPVNDYTAQLVRGVQELDAHHVPRGALHHRHDVALADAEVGEAQVGFAVHRKRFRAGPEVFHVNVPTRVTG